jgi:hypothetical protein
LAAMYLCPHFSQIFLVVETASFRLAALRVEVVEFLELFVAFVRVVGEGAEDFLAC